MSLITKNTVISVFGYIIIRYVFFFFWHVFGDFYWIPNLMYSVFPSSPLSRFDFLFYPEKCKKTIPFCFLTGVTFVRMVNLYSQHVA